MLPNKSYLVRAMYDWIVDSECTPYIAVDTGVLHVEVPLEYIQDNQIVLNTAPKAIRDLIIDPRFVSFRTKFGDNIHEIYLPIKSIVAIYAQEAPEEGMMFDDDSAPYAEHPMLVPIAYSEVMADKNKKASVKQPPHLTLVE